jgi:serine/threonine-protein kinase
MPEQPPAATDIRAAFERIAASPGFAGAGRLGPFLRYLVETSLAGQTGGLKESVLGVEVFGRPAGFDPRSDPIVRVEARRLRQRLDEYYAGPGAADALRIELPKGGYVPVFRRSNPARDRSPFPWPAWKIAAGVAVLAAVGIALGYFQSRYMARVRQAPLAAVAVLPFQNLNPEPDSDYFSDGLTEELTDRLSRVAGVKVVARSVMAQYKSSGANPLDIARQVSASVFVDGSVRRQAERVRVTARLVNPADGFQLWSQTYERELKDIFRIQDEIAQAITNALRVQFRQTAAVRSRATENLEAYNLYLRGRHQANLYSREGLLRAIEHFEQALKQQPGYAPASAGLAQTYCLLGYYGVLPMEKAGAAARRYARQAIEADPAWAEAHAALGLILAFGDLNWTEAEAAFRRALEVDPGSAIAHGLYASGFLMPQGRLSEAQAEFNRSLELDPLSSFVNFTSGFALLADGKYEEAVARYRRTLELKSIHPDMYWDYGMALSLAGRKQEARDAYRKNREMQGAPPDDLGGLEAFFAGDEARARRDLPATEKATREGRQERMDTARLCAMLGEKDKAIYWLEQAYAAREPEYVWVKVDPRLRSLRGDARHDELIRKAGLRP